MTEPTKRCSHCGQRKPLGDFYPDNTRDRHQSWCKKCMAENTVGRWQKDHALLYRRQKARQRAFQRLRDAHRREYDRYYQEALDALTQERDPDPG